MLLRTGMALMGMIGMGFAGEIAAADKAQLVELTGIPESALQVSPIEFPGMDCGIVDVLDTRVKGPDAARVLARLPDGWVPVDTSEVALRVIDSCASESSDPRALAQLIATLYQPRLNAVTEVKLPLVDTLLRKAGVSFQPPESWREDGAQMISFYALGPDGQSLLRLTASWQPGTRLRTQTEVLASVQ